jgi:hypothetical protein
MHCQQLQPFTAFKFALPTKWRKLKFGQHGRNSRLSVPPSINSSVAAHSFSKLFILFLLHSLTAFPISGISSDSSEHLFCWSSWKGGTGATHFGLKFLLNKDSCQTNLVFLCPIFELKLIRLDFVDVVLVDVEI